MTLLFYILLAFVFINSLYYLGFLYFGLAHKNKPLEGKVFPVSLIVCAKNEAENLKRNIPLWLKQAHPNFELIIIDDDSQDQTRDVIESFANQDPRIVPVFVNTNERFASSKKYALTLGIKKAKHLRLVFTDADCSPASANWLSIMARQFSAQKQLILGYGGHHKKLSFVNALARFETFITAIQYFSYAFAGIPYMGVGRNLAYSSLLYESQNGFSSHMDVISGDDDLFVNQAGTKENTALCLLPEAFTYSAAKATLGKWLNQKRRHITTANYYKPIHKFLLGLYYLGNLGFWISWGLFLFVHPKLALIVLIGRTVFQIISYIPTARKLKELPLLILTPFFELFLICMQLVIFILNLTSKRASWK